MIFGGPQEVLTKSKEPPSSVGLRGLTVEGPWIRSDFFQNLGSSFSYCLVWLLYGIFWCLWASDRFFAALGGFRLRRCRRPGRRRQRRWQLLISSMVILAHCSYNSYSLSKLNPTPECPALGRTSPNIPNESSVSSSVVALPRIYNTPFVSVASNQSPRTPL